MEINAQRVTKTFGTRTSAVTAIAEVTVRIESGELFFLLGPSGCGKTTLLRVMAGLTAPTGGSIYFGGRDVTGLPPEKRNAAMVFQNYALWPHMTVQRNVEFGPKMQGVKAAERQRLAQESLELVAMERFLHRKPNQLSGGQQQRVAVARALAARPDCLLLDEPLSNLDARLRLHMRTELVSLIKSAGTTAVYVTHDQKEALAMADRIAVMDNGAIVQVGTAEQLYNRPATRFVADFLGEANFIDGVVVSADNLMRIRTSVGDMYAAATDGVGLGDSMTCCLRPERVRLVSRSSQQEPRPGESVLAGVVRSATFLGEIHQYVCGLGEDTTWKVTALTDGSTPLEVGAGVRLSTLPDGVTVLRR